MSPREIQRTMDFILRSQADAVIRMDRWVEEWAERSKQWDERIKLWDEKFQKQVEIVHAENRGTAKIVHETAREVREIAKANRRHEQRIHSLEKSERRTTRRLVGLADIRRTLNRLGRSHSSR